MMCEWTGGIRSPIPPISTLLDLVDLEKEGLVRLVMQFIRRHDSKLVLDWAPRRHEFFEVNRATAILAP